MSATRSWPQSDRETDSVDWAEAADSLARDLANVGRTIEVAEQKLRHARISYEKLMRGSWVRDDSARERAHLTIQERRVALLAELGKSNREIAALTLISVDTVKGHMKCILRKLGLRSRWQLQGMFMAADPEAPVMSEAQ